MNKNIPTYLPTSLKISTKREHTHRSLLGSLLENTKIPASTQNKALPLITQKQSMIYIKNNFFFWKNQPHKFFVRNQSTASLAQKTQKNGYKTNLC